MKHRITKLIATSMLLALPLCLTSCDNDDDDTTTTTTNTGGNTGGNTGSTSGTCYLEGRTINYNGTFTTTSNTTTPVASSTDTTTEYDLDVAFQAAGVTNVTGTINITAISTTVSGITTNITQGLGQQNVNTNGTYICSSSAPSNPAVGDTLVFEETQDGITTTYTLTFTTTTSGTFTTSVRGTTSGVSISGSGSGTFQVQ